MPKTLLNRILLSIAVGGTLLVAFAIVFVAGLVVGNVQIYSKFAESQSEKIGQLIEDNPLRYGDLRVQLASDGWAHPVGEVQTEKEVELLRDDLKLLFGEEYSIRMASCVSAKKPASIP